jgi:hypothetical protein
MVIVSYPNCWTISPAENPLKYDRYDALPTNRQEFMDMFVDSVTGDLIENGSAQAYAWSDFILRYPRQESLSHHRGTHEKVPITSIQYTEYIKARVKERQLEDKVAKEGIESTTQSVHKAYSRPLLNFVFPWKTASGSGGDEVRADMDGRIF